MHKKIVARLSFLLIIFYSAGLFAQGFGAGNYGQAVGARKETRSSVQNKGFQNFAGQQHGEKAFNFSAAMNGGDNGGALAGTYQVHILGQVDKPGTYRLLPSTHLDEAINTAGGITPKGSFRGIELRRGGKNVAYDLLRYKLEGALSQNPFLFDNDVIFIPYAQKSVAIQGPVKNAITFELKANEENIWDLLNLAGGFTAGVSFDADIKVIRFVNEKREILSVANKQEELKAFQLYNGDIVIIPHILTKDRTFDYEISELPADNVFYPSFNDNVFVIGAISLPGAYPFNPVYKVNDFVKMAGPNRTAQLNSIQVLTTNGKQLRGRGLKTYHLSPGDTIVVPEKSFTADNVLRWYGAITGSIITGFTVRELVK